MLYVMKSKFILKILPTYGYMLINRLFIRGFSSGCVFGLDVDCAIAAPRIYIFVIFIFFI